MSTLPIGGRRWTASSSRDGNRTGSGESAEKEPNWNDFLAVLTHATNLYSQPGVYEMQMVDGSKTASGLIYGRGAVGQVSAANTDIAQPSTLYSTQVDNRTVDYVIKQYPDGLWSRHGEALNSAEAACFMAELRVLSNPVVRNSGKIVKILGLAWTLEKVMSPVPFPCRLYTDRQHVENRNFQAYDHAGARRLQPVQATRPVRLSQPAGHLLALHSLRGSWHCG